MTAAPSKPRRRLWLILLGLVTNLSATYLPSNYTYYSIIVTFALLVVVLALRPNGLFGRPA